MIHSYGADPKFKLAIALQQILGSAMASFAGSNPDLSDSSHIYLSAGIKNGLLSCTDLLAEGLQ